MENSTKRIILNILSFWQYQVKNDKCDTETINSVAKAVSKDICTYSSAQDIGKHFGKESKDVHNIINRNRWGDKLKPIRKVLYNIGEILPLIPSKWKSKE